MSLDDILKNIELTGAADDSVAPVKQLVNVTLENVTDRSSGLLRIRPNIKTKFGLILSNPISALHAIEIRCLNCHRIISYPAWHYKIVYARNVMHYFLCFNDGKVSLNCRKV